MNFFFSSRRRHTFFFQAEDGIRDRSPSRGLGDVYKRQQFISPIFEFKSECDKSDKSDKNAGCMDTRHMQPLEADTGESSRYQGRNSGTQHTTNRNSNAFSDHPEGPEEEAKKDKLRHRSSTWMILASPHRANHQPTNGVMNANERQ